LILDKKLHKDYNTDTKNKRGKTMTVKDEERLLKLEEAASRLRVKPNTLRKWLRTGYVPGLKIAATWRLKVENLEEFIKFREAETKKKINEERI